MFNTRKGVMTDTCELTSDRDLSTGSNAKKAEYSGTRVTAVS